MHAIYCATSLSEWVPTYRLFADSAPIQVDLEVLIYRDLQERIVCYVLVRQGMQIFVRYFVHQPFMYHQ